MGTLNRVLITFPRHGFWQQGLKLKAHAYTPFPLATFCLRCLFPMFSTVFSGVFLTLQIWWDLKSKSTVGMDSIAYYEQVYSCLKKGVFTHYIWCERDFNVTLKEHWYNDPAVVPLKTRCSKPSSNAIMFHVLSTIFRVNKAITVNCCKSTQLEM